MNSAWTVRIDSLKFKTVVLQMKEPDFHSPRYKQCAPAQLLSPLSSHTHLFVFCRRQRFFVLLHRLQKGDETVSSSYPWCGRAHREHLDSSKLLSTATAVQLQYMCPTNWSVCLPDRCGHIRPRWRAGSHVLEAAV